MTNAIETKDPKVAVDPQDPLPESNWIPRRRLAFGVTSATFIYNVMVWWALAFRPLPLATIEALTTLAVWTWVGVLVMWVLYLVAPSAEQAAKMLATVSALRGGVAFRSSAQVQTPQGGTATTTLQAGKPGATPPISSAAGRSSGDIGRASPLNLGGASNAPSAEDDDGDLPPSERVEPGR